MNVIEIIMLSGKTAVNIAIYTMLPVMIVVLCIMKMFEESGILGRVINLTAPFLRPLGLTGLSTVALLQINFINFAAPLATLALMDRQKVSDRHMAATLAMLLAMAQGNILYPVYALGLAWTPALGISVAGGLMASALTWYLFARPLSGAGSLTSSAESVPHQNRLGIIDVISRSGTEAMKLAAGTIPMLTLTVALYNMLDVWGVVHGLEKLLEPALVSAGIPGGFVGLTLAKYLGGGTACYSVMTDLIHNGYLTVNEINRSAGFLINSFDLPGIGIFMGISARFPRIFRFALPGALVGIAFRTLLHLFI